MGKKMKLGTKVVAGGTAATVCLVGGGVATHFLQERGHAGAHGAVVDMNEQNGMLLYDLKDRPAFANYFDKIKQGQMRMSVSISTTDAMPSGLTNKLGQLTKYRQQHVSSKVAPTDYRPIDEGSAEVIRTFFKEFEELTGIKVHVKENDPKADIVIGGYESDDEYIGFASFPQEIPLVAKLSQNQGFMMLDTEYLKKKLEQGRPEAILALVSHEFGHNFGILHPHDGMVHTAMNDKQQDAVARMSYNNHTFPAISGTQIDSGFGPLEIRVLREALRELGVEPPPINAGNDTYLLSEAAEEQREQARAKSGVLASMPALTLVDSGGKNTLEGTSGDDLLVTESGYCGLLKRDEKEIRLTKDGQPYCLVEGEFSVVRSGGGDDLILTANGTEQTVFLGTGNNDVALIHRNPGNKTLVTLPIEQDEGALENFLESVNDLNPLTEGEEAPERATEETVREDSDKVTLTLHQSLFRNSDAHAEQYGDDIVVTFRAMSGREVGRVTLQGQAAEDRGVNTFRVIDDNGDNVAEYDVTELRDAAIWQEEVIAPTQEKVEEAMMENMRADLSKARQMLAGRAGEWTSEGEDPSLIKDDIGGATNWSERVNTSKPSIIQYPKNNKQSQPNHEQGLLRRRFEDRSHERDIF